MPVNDKRGTLRREASVRVVDNMAFQHDCEVEQQMTAEAYINQLPVSAAIPRKSFLYGDLQPKDVFNPDNYGEEEFGPDDPKAKVKKTRKKKKVTKAIVVFGGAEEAAEAKKSVKIGRASCRERV